MAMISILEDTEFLMAQREEGRRGSMSSVDNILSEKEKRKLARLANEEKRRQKTAEAAKSLVEITARDIDSCSDDSDDCTSAVEESNDPDSLPSTILMTTSRLKRRKRGRQEVLTPSLSPTLDHNKISDRTALMIVGKTAKTLGHDVTSMATASTRYRSSD